MLKIARDLSARTLLLWVVEALLLSQAASSGRCCAGSDTDCAGYFWLYCLWAGWICTCYRSAGRGGYRIWQPYKITADHQTHHLLAALAAAIMSAGLALLQGLIIPAMTSQPPFRQRFSDLWLWCVLIPPVSFLAFQMDGSMSVRPPAIICEMGWLCLSRYLPG